MRGNPELETLARDYFAWQKRTEVLAAERPEIHGRLMELQQSALKRESDPKVLQAAKVELVDMDQKLEAAAAKLKFLWGQMDEAVVVDIEAKRTDASQTEAAFEREFQELSHQAGLALGQAMNLCGELGFNVEYLSYIMGLKDTGFKNLPKAITEHPIAVAFNQTRREPLDPSAPENASVWIVRFNNWRNFLLATGSPGSRELYVRCQINKKIQSAGGSPRPGPSPFFGRREAQYVGKNL